MWVLGPLGSGGGGSGVQYQGLFEVRPSLAYHFVPVLFEPDLGLVEPCPLKRVHERNLGVTSGGYLGQVSPRVCDAGSFLSTLRKPS